MDEHFSEWGRAVVDAAASLLEAEIPGARRVRPRKLSDHEAAYVHFQDAHLPQAMAVWLYATCQGTAYNVSGYGDVIGVGLKQDKDVELDQAVWRFRRLSLFSWHTHVDDRREGLRWMCEVGDLPQDPLAAGGQIAERVLAALRRARAIAEPP